jgi:hypothetical protein
LNAVADSSAGITTTGDIYTDWDIDQLEATMRYVVGEDDAASTDNAFVRPFPPGRSGTQ